MQESNGQKSDIKGKGKSENPEGFLLKALLFNLDSKKDSEDFWDSLDIKCLYENDWNNSRRISLLWDETSLLKHQRNITNGYVCDYISVLMICLVDGALLKDDLIKTQFSKILTFCFIKLLNNWRKLAKIPKRHLTKKSTSRKNIWDEKIG